MVGCRRCRQFGFIHLPLGNVKFQQWLEHHHVTTETFHDLLSVLVFPRTRIRRCPCCGDDEGWWYEPGLHYTTGDCREDAEPTPAEIILIRNQVHPLYWEYALTREARYDLPIRCDGDSPYFGPGGNRWDQTLNELEALKRTPTQPSATIP